MNKQISGIFGVFSGIGDVLLGIFEGDSDKVTDGLESIFMGIFDTIIAQIYNMPKMMLQLVGVILKGLGDLLKFVIIWLVTDGVKMLWTAIKGIFTFLWTAIKKTVEGLGTLLMGIFKFLTDPAFRNDVIERATGLARNLVDGLMGGLASIWDYIKTWFSDIWTAFAEYWGINSPSTVMADLGMNLVDGLVKSLLFMPKKMLEIAEQAWNFLKETFGLQKVEDAGKSIVDGLINGVSSLKDKMKEKAGEAWSAVKGVFGIASPSKEAASAGEFITEGFTKGIGGLKDTFKDVGLSALTSFTSTLKSIDIAGLGSIVKSFGLLDEIVQTVSSLSSNIDKVLNVGLSSKLFSLVSIDFNKIIKYFKDFATGINSIIAPIEKIKHDEIKMISSLVTDIVEDIRIINTSLESLGDIEMNATIEKLGKDLGIKDNIIKLERKPITMNVQLNLTMKAEDIAKEIFDVSAKMVNANPNDPAVKNMAAAYGVSPK
jgi:hypothetical protein